MSSFFIYPFMYFLTTLINQAENGKMNTKIGEYPKN